MSDEIRFYYMTAEELTEAHEKWPKLYNDGWTIAEIAAEFGRGMATVYRILTAEKVQFRPAWRRPKKR